MRNDNLIVRAAGGVDDVTFCLDSRSDLIFAQLAFIPINLQGLFMVGSAHAADAWQFILNLLQAQHAGWAVHIWDLKYFSHTITNYKIKKR